jgi:hypothetical protein
MNTSTANQKKKSMSSHSDDLVAKKAWNPGEERARMRYRTDTQPRGIYGKNGLYRQRKAVRIDEGHIKRSKGKCR